MKKILLLTFILPLLSCGIKKELAKTEQQNLELVKKNSDLEKKQRENEKQNVEFYERLEKQVSENKTLTNNISILENVNKDLVVRNDSLFSQLLQIVELNGKNKDFKLPTSLKKKPAKEEIEIDYYDDMPPPPPPPKPRIKGVNQIYDYTEEKAMFPGGEENLMKFIESNLKYPNEAKRNNLEGTSYIRFIVEQDGSLSDLYVVRGLGSGCDKEAMRIIKLMPKWIPGKQRGRAVRSRFILPIKFKLK